MRAEKYHFFFICVHQRNLRLNSFCTMLRGISSPQITQMNADIEGEGRNSWPFCFLVKLCDLLEKPSPPQFHKAQVSKEASCPEPCRPLRLTYFSHLRSSVQSAVKICSGSKEFHHRRLMQMNA